MADDTPAHYLAALAVPEVGPARLRRLLEAFGSVDDALHAPPGRLAAVDGAPPQVWAAFGRHARAALAGAERVVADARAAGLTVLCWSDADYPAPLRADPSGCAPVLFVEGALPPAITLPYPRVRSVAVVGTRRPSSVAEGLARDLGRNLAREGLVVVSGLAYGIDAAAHRGALEGGAESLEDAARGTVGHQYRTDARAEGPWPGATVAVLGGGHHVLYPAAHRSLAEAIVRGGGAIVSEWPPHVRARPHHFLQRNRVISALARVVVVVQAGESSGALSTATHAAEQGRTVLVVPAFPGYEKFAGSLALLREGAPPVVDESDVLHHFSELHAAPRPAAPSPSGVEPDDEPAADGARGASAHRRPSPAAATVMVRRLLEERPELAIDELIARSGLAAAEVLGALTRLEIAGEAMRGPNGRYRRRTRAS
ncbi:MAG: DNA-processing protein DprA [Trueperaceae bacterium]